jgi:hypothetical protein
MHNFTLCYMNPDRLIISLFTLPIVSSTTPRIQIVSTDSQSFCQEYLSIGVPKQSPLTKRVMASVAAHGELLVREAIYEIRLI